MLTLPHRAERDHVKKTTNKRQLLMFGLFTRPPTHVAPKTTTDLIRVHVFWSCHHEDCEELNRGGAWGPGGWERSRDAMLLLF